MWSSRMPLMITPRISIREPSWRVPCIRHSPHSSTLPLDTEKLIRLGHQAPLERWPTSSYELNLDHQRPGSGG